MRIYRDFKEAQNEIQRDLAELGVSVHPETMQDKDIKDDPDFDTKELQNYIYSVTDPDWDDVEGVHKEWVEKEWDDRVTGDLNPGTSWKARSEVWIPFLEGRKGRHVGRFSYTYSERMGGVHIQAVIDELKAHPTSRQLYLPVWAPITDERRRGARRVPCSLGYWFVQRNDEIHLTYMMRSCDFFTHYPNDVALATMLQHYIARETGYQVGTFIHFIGSLHVYAKDVAHVF